MIPLDKFMVCVRENAARVREYESGGDGNGGKCDCIGLIIGALGLAGFRWPGVHGSNWAARNAMSCLGFILEESAMFCGEIVYKAKLPGEAGYDLPDKYKGSGDLKDYYHVGVVTCVNPLQITHCTSRNGVGGVYVDNAMGNWRWGGELKYVNYEEGVKPMEPIYQATVHADNDYPVKMRAQASTKADVLAKIPQGTVVDVLGIVGSDEGDWGFILYGDQTGYMMTKFLLPVNNEAGEEDGNVTVRRAQLEFIADTLNDLVENIREMIGRG